MAPGPAPTEADCTAWFGQPFRAVVTGVVSMLLYLCIDQPDIIERNVPLSVPRRSSGTPATARVIETGWRIGADLTAARHAHRDDPGTGPGADEAGRAVTPHLRRPHWHSYWIGPRTHPENRQLVLRYIAPVLVGVKDLDLPVTVRTAQPPR